MSDGTIRLPSWIIPIVLSCAVGLVTYGTAKAEVGQNTQEIQELRTTVKATAEKAVQNGTLSSVNEAKIDAVVKSLEEMNVTQTKTQESIEDLVKVLLEQNRD